MWKGDQRQYFEISKVNELNESEIKKLHLFQLVSVDHTRVLGWWG